MRDSRLRDRVLVEAGRARADRRIFHAQRFRTLSNWQRHLKAGPAVWPTRDIDAAIVGHDDLLDQREAETGPSFFVVKNGRKTFSRASTAIPGPLSCTVTRATA